jgi:hypothetical protein
MNYRENKCTPQGTRIYRGEVTSRYRKRPIAVFAGYHRIRNDFVPYSSLSTGPSTVSKIIVFVEISNQSLNNG